MNKNHVRPVHRGRKCNAVALYQAPTRDSSAKRMHICPFQVCGRIRMHLACTGEANTVCNANIKVGFGWDVVSSAARWFLTLLVVRQACFYLSLTLESVRQVHNKAMRCHCALSVQPTAHARPYKLRYVSWVTF